MKPGDAFFKGLEAVDFRFNGNVFHILHWYSCAQEEYRSSHPPLSTDMEVPIVYEKSITPFLREWKSGRVRRFT